MLVIWMLLYSDFLPFGECKNSKNQKKPNIILLVTDDQDIHMKSEDVMEKTRKLLVEQGLKFKNAFTTTPTCCPSRSSFLTGLYAHNHGIMTNNGNCTGKEWKEKFEKRTYGVKLQELGYKTSFFGKYLNEYAGDYIPEGWSKWFGLVKNSRYYNYTIANWEEGKNGKTDKDCDPTEKCFQKEKFGNEQDEYLTTVITRTAIKYFRKLKKTDPEKPVLMVLNFPAPHGPEDASPKYENSLEPGGRNYEKYKHLLSAHRNSMYNKVDKAEGSKHWFLRYLEPFDKNAERFTDFLQKKRLQTLFSVDDSIEKIYNAVDDIGELENTYFIFTSDHGYHLGQFGVVKGKALPYDFDTRIPFYFSGPGLPQNETRSQIVLNIDLMPTLLEIAGTKKWAKEQEKQLDGASFLNIARGMKTPWRDYFLIERGKFPMNVLNPRPNRQNYLKEICERPEYKNPDNNKCGPKQSHYCIKEPTGFKIEKCEISRHGLKLSNGDCCCHGCLKKNERKNNYCPQRSKRAANDPIYQPLDDLCLMREADCICTSKLNGTAHHTKPKVNQKPKPLNELREQMKADKRKYEANKLYHSFIRNQHNKSERKEKVCGQRGLACYSVDRGSFQTKPYWDGDPGCYCSNASNGTFFCIRGLNQTDNYLYCSFMTNDIEYYNLDNDPDAKLNLWSLPPESVDSSSARKSKIEQLSELKDQLFRCQGESCKPEIQYPKFRNRKKNGAKGRTKRYHKKRHMKSTGEGKTSLSSESSPRIVHWY